MDTVAFLIINLEPTSLLTTISLFRRYVLIEGGKKAIAASMGSRLLFKSGNKLRFNFEK